MVQFFHIIAKSDSEADVLLYGDIARWASINARDFANRLKDLESKYSTINLRINSPGGDIFEGLSIYNLIKSSPLTINTFNDGMAASMGSILLIGGDHVSMAETSRMMIHQGSGFIGGSAEQIKNFGDLLSSLNKTLSEIYASKTGKDAKWIMDNWMQEGKDKWFTAKEAKSAGLVDEIIKGKVKKMPDPHQGYFEMAAHYNEELENEFNEQNQNTMTDLKKMAVSLGLPENATEDQILEAIEKINKKSPEKDLNALLALAETKGLNKEMIELAAKADYDKTFKMVNEHKVPETKEESGTETGKETGKETDKETTSEVKHESLAEAIKAAITGTSGGQQGKKLKDYSVDELEKMKAENRKEYDRLYKAEFGIDASKAEAYNAKRD